MSEGLSHIGHDGAAHMVDITQKVVTHRVAEAEATVFFSDQTLAALNAGDAPKGDVLGTARLAGIMAAKKTSELIPLCHPLPISGVKVTFEVIDQPASVRILGRVKTTGQTGVEMEALTAVSVAALTIYDMLKAVQKDMTITAVQLVSKTGGKSGDYHKDA